MSNIFIYDIEVYSHDWIVDFRDPEFPDHTTIHNNTSHLREFMAYHSEKIFGAFNDKGYDRYIMMALLLGADNLEIKRFNDYIIHREGDPWDYPFIKGARRPFKSFDLRDDIPKDLSLKAIEGNMKHPIVESETGFDIDRPLTKEELKREIRYCRTDVDRTVDFFNVRKPDYLDAKILIGEMYDVPVADALGMTNAKLCARILGARKTIRNDERNYIVPDNIDLNQIPKPVFDFFMQIRDKTIPDAVLFGDGQGKKGLTFTAWFETSFGRCPVTYAWGGVHGAKPCVMVENTDERVILNYDVASLYPNSMLNFGYCSRSMADPEAYRRLVEKRLGYKHSGDKLRSDALKLPINTTYGAMLNQHNDLADRWAGRSVCISNQLAMTMLIVALGQSCESIDFVNINTDGIMFTINKTEIDRAEKIINDWSEVTRFEMERDDFVKVIQKDVNNYIGITAEVDKKTGRNKFKTKGGFVSLYGGGSFKSNSMAIIDKAVVDYLVNGTPVEETIGNCKDIFAFQTIAKTGGTYAGAFHEVNGERVPVQKVNRFYAVKNPIYGKIKKGKWITEKRRKNHFTGKMESTPVDPPIWSESDFPDSPDHCFIDNTNVLSVDDIDRDYYINIAKKRIKMYTVIDSKKQRELDKIKEVINIMAKATEKTPEYQGMNVYQKLEAARKMFAEKNVKKSGVNRYAEFKYFTLDDIIPAKIEIFKEVGLCDFTQFNERGAMMRVVNVDDPEDYIDFTSSLAPDESLISNPIQKLGAVQTYVRRYLHLMMLDIVEPETVDEISGQDKPKTPAKKVQKHATNDERKAAKETITDANGAADDAQIDAIKKGLKKYRDTVENYDEVYIKNAAKRIKAGLTKTEAEDLLIEIGEKLA